MRVYVPSTLPALAALLRAGEISPPVRAFAVTPALREWYASGDDEELEYSAMTQAAGESLRLIAASPGAPRQRVVLAAEVPPDALGATRGGGSAPGGTDLEHPAEVLVEAVIPASKVVSAHVDELTAEPDIRAAADALPAADAGDNDARFIVDGAEGHELLWYGPSELLYLFA
jgi:hypothetical protein